MAKKKSLEAYQIYQADCRDVILPDDCLIVTDPPYNIGYKYLEYSDRMTEKEYLKMFERFAGIPSVFIHYPEETIKYIVPAMGVPDEVVAWVYNTNTKREHRMISWYNCKPDFSQVKQPYKNISDRRILERIANGSKGTDLYDWWEIDLVKNVSNEKTEYTNQIPEKVIGNIIQTTQVLGQVVVDPFCGSGTTCAVAEKLNVPWIGIDQSEKAVDISRRRLKKLQNELPF